ncbi:PREDICTED: probable G-protein coupled receptor 45 [Acropora digitifera]|uniref:probable G-protein coupled receptor 45 n=1 Tax=Acropora digitifera TaxID=70779 RepID=UPI00077A38CC|nr:PREDICTED: probable G-protein coupled receptor 45 [Acropora digitifera]
MALANDSKSEDHGTLTDFLCSEVLTKGIHDDLRWISALNILLSVSAFLGNATVLLALSKVSALHPPSKLLFRTLAVTDLCVGVISQPLTVVSLMSQVNGEFHVCRYASNARFLASCFLCAVSLQTSTAINVDRLFALSLRLRYRQFVTLKRMYAIVILFWILSIAFTAAWFISTTVTTLYAVLVLFSSLATSGFSYAKIFILFRRNQVDTRTFWQRQNEAAPVNASLYRKTVYTVLWVQLALIVCYLPYSIVQVLITRRGGSLSLILAWRYTGTLLLFNSSLNPLLYCWKMRAVKKAMKETIRQLICSFRCC